MPRFTEVMSQCACGVFAERMCEQWENTFPEWVGGGRRIEVARAGRSQHIVHMCVGTFAFLD